MLTQRKLLIVGSNELSKLKFEGIKVINTIQDVERTWKQNKTPFINKGQLRFLQKYPILEIPEYIVRADDFITFCHNNGIECGEQVLDKKYDTAKEDCFLCESKYYSSEDYNRSCVMESLVMYQSEHFFVKIELGCLCPGMVMICPKEHILSAAQIPKNQIQEYLNVQKDVEFILKEIFGKEEKVIFFEHGSAPDGISTHKRSIVHAHTHVAIGVPFEQKYLETVCLQKVDDLKLLSTVKYFSYQEGTDGDLLAVSDPEVYIQRQYPRQVIGEMLGIPNEKTNWRIEPFTENIIKTYDCWYEFLSKNAEFLSARIVKSTECFVKVYPERRN